MYLAYYDESGDDGYPKFSSKLFVLSCVYLSHGMWKDVYAKIQEIRKRLQRSYSLPVKLEMHTKGFILNKNPYKKYNFSDNTRIQIIDSFCRFVSDLDLKIINVVINKEAVNSPKYNVLETALTYSVQRLENDLNKNKESKRFMILTDEGRIGKMRKTTRKIQRINIIPSQFTAQSYRKEIELLIEDPLEKKSSESYLIQISDMVAYIVFLYSTIHLGTGTLANRMQSFVNESRIIYWMELLKKVFNTDASQYNEYGVVIYPR